MVMDLTYNQGIHGAQDQANALVRLAVFEGAALWLQRLLKRPPWGEGGRRGRRDSGAATAALSDLAKTVTMQAIAAPAPATARPVTGPSS